MTESSGYAELSCAALSDINLCPPPTSTHTPSSSYIPSLDLLPSLPALPALPFREAFKASAFAASTNTTLPIKSAPPRTRSTIADLATHGGLLTKRNESNSWVTRHCFVVPHYFEDLDAASPAGIIDLECYSEVVRQEGNILELRGSSSLNPSLRRFYFQADSVKACEDWTEALLKQRHRDLEEEVAALSELQTNFALQLKACNVMVDESEQKERRAVDELYEVRSANEKMRGEVMEVLREVFYLGRISPNEGLQGIVEEVIRQHKFQGAKVGLLSRELFEKDLEVKEFGRKVADEMMVLQNDFEVALARAVEEAASERQQTAAVQVELGATQNDLTGLRVEFNILGGVKDKIEAKKRDLHDQKKVLVQEVLMQRRLTAELSAKVDKLEGALRDMRHDRECERKYAVKEKERGDAARESGMRETRKPLLSPVPSGFGRLQEEFVKEPFQLSPPPASVPSSVPTPARDHPSISTVSSKSSDESFVANFDSPKAHQITVYTASGEAIKFFGNKRMSELPFQNLSPTASSGGLSMAGGGRRDEGASIQRKESSSSKGRVTRSAL